MIQSVHGEGNILFRDGVEAHLLREKLPDQSIHVLVGTALPRRIGMGKEEVGVELFGDPFMLGKLLAVVRRQRVHESLERRQQGDHRVRDVLRTLRRNVGNQGIAGSPLVDGNQSLLMAGADHQIGFPIAETLASVSDLRSLVNRHLIWDRAAPFAARITLSACLLAAQGAVQRSTGTLVGIDALIAALVTDTGLVVGLELARNLLGAPRLVEFLINDGPYLLGDSAAVVRGPHAGL